MIEWLNEPVAEPSIADALNGGGPVRAILVQSTNPVSVAPEQSKVIKGFEREDLFTVVHEHFMTDTARYADLLLPATMFTEHDDIYQGGGHQYIGLGPKLIDPPGECRSNHWVLCEIAKRVGASHQAFIFLSDLDSQTAKFAFGLDLHILEAFRIHIA
mgnify:CR=1 FL=1